MIRIPETGTEKTEKESGPEKAPLPVTYIQAMDALGSIKDAVIFVDGNSRVTYANKAAGQLFSLPPGEITGKSLPGLYQRPPTALFYQHLRKALTEGKAASFKEPVRMFNRWLGVSIRPSGGGAAICLHDETPDVLVQEVHMVAYLLTEKLKDMVFIISGEWCVIYVNQEVCNALGYTREELLSMGMPEIGCGAGQKAFGEQWNDVKNSGSVTYETNYTAKDGRQIPVEVSANHLKYYGTEYCCIAARDITQRKQAEEELTRSNNEKELLLKEIHHRVKNNLQIISSLLNLQSSSVDKADLAASFKESQNRIRSMALIHEKLYRSRDLARIDFKDYIQSLVRSLAASYCVGSGVGIELDIEDIALDIDNAIPCGLIINELVSNSMKHAFKDRQSGTIRVALLRDHEYFTLTVSDDGPGMPTGIDFRNTTSLGLQLVVTLTEQMDGDIELLPGKGTTFRIRFKGCE